jgi:transposase-like protein
MNILNKEELRKQIREGKEISLDGILDEFKFLLRESLQTASEEELSSHLGYEKYQESENSNYRNGTNKKSLKTKYGQVDVAIPRDRDGTFEPKLVPKRERILKGSEELILSLYAKGMSVSDISSHLDDLYGYQLSEQTISNITESIMDKAKEWQSRPLESIYPIVFMDATVLKIRVDSALP